MPRPRIRLPAALLAAALLPPCAAHAQDAARQDYRLPAAPLEQTLLRIASDAGVALAYDPALLANVSAAPVDGHYNAIEALGRALAGSGFELAPGAGGGLTIRRAVVRPAVDRRAVPSAPRLKVGLRIPAASALASAPPAAAGIATVTVNGARPERADDEDPQRTPTSAYRVDGAELERQNVNTLEELQQLVPGMNVQSTDPSDTQISIRGVGDGGGQASGDQNIGMPSGVAVYLDNVWLPRPGMLGSGLGDIDWVDVLSGAQGTMFGANSTGGVLDIHTRAPSFVPEAAATVSLGQNGYRRVRALLSGPLSDNVAGRLNLIGSETDGAVTNLRNGHNLDSVHSNGARGQLLFRVGDRFRLRLSADYNNTNTTPTSVLVATHAVAGRDTFQTHSAAAGNHVVFGPGVDLDDESRIHVVQGGVSAQAEWTFDSGWRLRSVSSSRYYHATPSTADNLSVRAYYDSGWNTRDRTWSQQFRLDSPVGRAVDYALGFDALGEHLDTVAHTRYGNSTVPVLFYDSASYRNLDVIRYGKLRDRMLSPFAQGTWHAAENVDVTAGVRANVERKGGQFIRQNRSAFNSGFLEEYHTLPSGTLVVTWRPAPGWSTYAAASYGEKSGGLNISSGAAAKAGLDSLYLKPETTRSAEIGVKTAFADQRVLVKADLFQTGVSDFQTQGYDPDTQQTYLLNAGSFRARGAEGTVRVLAGRYWTIDASAVYNDAAYRSYRNARCAPEVTLAPNPPASCDLTGQRVFNAPRLTANVSTRYGWTSEGGLKNFVGARYAWRSWMYGTVDNSAFTRVPGYGLATFSAGTSGRLDQGDWSATLWLNNAFDKTYYRRLVNGDYGSVVGWLGQQRTLGFTLGYRY
jgi:iron complex outermembrane receptor protein